MGDSNLSGVIYNHLIVERTSQDGIWPGQGWFLPGGAKELLLPFE